MSPNRSEPDENSPVVRRGAPTRIGRYDLIERVGHGSLGTLYLGRDSVLGRDVAVKVMAAGLLGNAGAHARFFRDAKAAARLQHANIVTIFEFGEHEQTPYVVMEFLRGSNLADRLRQGPPLSLSQKLDSAIQLCAGLEAAHAQDVIHRDVKPRNIWVCDNGTVKVLDFGIATAATASGTVDVFASPGYMSPEQITSKPVDRRTDIYSCGAVLYELFAGHRPFEAPTPAGVLMKIVNESAPPIVNPEVPATLTAVIMRAMERSPDARYSRASELGRELKTIKAQLTLPSDATVLLDRTALHVPIEPEPESVPVDAVEEEGPRPAAVITGPRGLPATILAIVVGAILLAVAVFALLWYAWPAPQAPAPASVPAPAPSASEPAAATAPAAPPPAVTPPPAATSITVKFDSRPPGAKILIAGRDTGLITPADVPVELSQLPARARFELAGFRAEETDLTSETVQNPVNVSLSPREVGPRGRLVGNGEYAFEVLDGRRVISASSERHDLAVSGLRSLRLRSDRYFLDQNLRVSLVEGGTVQVSAPPLGSVTVTGVGALANCQVFINDRLVDGGTLPVSSRAIASGVHRVRLSCSSGETQTRTVTVLPHQNSAVQFAPEAPAAR